MNTARRISIKVRGRLSDRLAAAFEGMSLVRCTGATELVGDIADQAQLHGVLSRIRDLGLELQSVTVTGPRQAGEDKDV
jgi:hypothetical protein